jgi:hypothetical protein
VQKYTVFQSSPPNATFAVLANHARCVRASCRSRR